MTDDNLSHRLLASRGTVSLGKFLHQLSSGIELGILSHQNAGGLDEQHEREVERRGVFHHDDWLLGLIELCRSRLDINFARFRQGACCSFQRVRPTNAKGDLRRKVHRDALHITVSKSTAENGRCARVPPGRSESTAHASCPNETASNSQAFVSAATCFRVSCNTV